jgi:putative transposase
LPKTTDGEEESDEGLKRATRIKLDPTPEWRQRLKTWCGTARWIYNKCLDRYNKGKCKMSKKQFRGQVVGGHNHGERKKRTGKKAGGNRRSKKHAPPMSRKTSWVLETPYEIRDAAMCDLIKAFQSNLAKKRKNPEHSFELKFKSRKGDQTIAIKRSLLGHDYTLFKRMTNGEPLHAYEDYMKYTGDVKITMTKGGEFYMHVLRDTCIATDIYEDTMETPVSVLSLDPGIRTFMTGYDHEGKILEYGRGDIGRIYRMCAHMDLLQSKAFDKERNAKQRYRLRKAWYRMIEKIKNLVKDVHCKVAKHLCENYDVVLLPAFGTHDMVRRAGRKIGKKTSRAMMTWSFYRFEQMLKAKALEMGTRVIMCTEEYTSKTCTRCGHIKKNLGGAKVYNCQRCHLKIGRDISGARNIALKNLVEHMFVVS